MPRKLIVFNEQERVEAIIKNGFTHNVMNFHDLTLLAKYYFSEGLSKNKIKQKLVEICRREDSEFNLIINEKKIDKAVKIGLDYKLKNPLGVNIPVYKKELEKIKYLPKNLYKICFVMLVLARYNKFSSSKRVQVKRKTSGSYYVNANFLDIMRMAGLSKSPKVKESNVIKYELGGVRKLISAYEFNNESWKVLFAEDGTGDSVVVLVTDIENVSDFIPFFCIDCGTAFEERVRRDRCDDCYKIHRKETIRKSVEKSRKVVNSKSSQ